MSLEYYEKGKGETILFLCGATATFPYYIRFLKLLSKNYRVICPNYPGLGNSPNPSNLHSLGFYIKELDYFIKEKKLENFHLAGASFGGYLAIEYTHFTKGKEIRSLILFSPLTKAISSSKFENAIRISLTQLQKWKNSLTPLTLNVFSLKNFEKWGTKMRHSDFVLKSRFNKSHIPKKIPILLILGERDFIVDTKFTKSQFLSNRNVQVIAFPSHGHDAFATIGDKVLAIIKNFTQSI